MTNGEFYLEDIRNIIDRGYQVEILNGKPVVCDGSRCETCYRNYDTGNFYMCSDLKFVEWYNSEYVPPKPKLTKRQRAFCECIGSGWMVRQPTDSIYIFSNRPVIKIRETCDEKRYCKAENDNKSPLYLSTDYLPDFPFITNEDGPISIAEMLTWEVE